MFRAGFQHRYYPFRFLARFCPISLACVAPIVSIAEFHKVAISSPYDATVTFILLSFARPQNIQRILDAILASKYCGRIILSNNQPAINILDHIEPPGERLEVIQQKQETLPINRYLMARECPGEFFVCIDDDIFLTTGQIDSVIAALIEDPARPHGVWGQDIIVENGKIRIKLGVHGVSREVTILNQVYAFTRVHVQNFFRILAAIECADPYQLGPVEDIVLSYSGAARPFCHDVGALNTCPTSNQEGIALWKSGGFADQRLDILGRIWNIQKSTQINLPFG
jgi:hypothetical protein